MRNASRYLLLIASAPLLASCVFLLNYDDLKRDKNTPANTGGAESAAGGATAGVVGGAGASVGAVDGGAPGETCGDCNDGDACTIDTCDQTGAHPECAHELTEGLKLDGFETTLTSEHHARVSLVAGGQQFFFASLQSDKGTPQVSLYHLANDGEMLESVGAKLDLDGVPVSNVGLAIEELAVGEVALHGFVATKLRLPNAAARVFHIVGQGESITTNLAGVSYAEGNETLFPQALAIGNKVIGAWIQADGTIAVHNVGTAKTDTFGAVTSPATTLALLATANNQPAVMFTAQVQPMQALGTYVETAGQNRTKFGECETRAGDYLSSSVISTQLPGLWLANVTRFGTGYLTTGGGALACDKGVCVALPEDCNKATPSNALRNIAGATVRFDDHAPGIVYSVVALPQVAVKGDDPNAVEAKLSLALGRSDFSDRSKISSTTIGGDPATGLMQIAHNDTSDATGFAGPDWPAVAILPTKQVAVAWIQPNPTADGTELHIQRYKMCLPPP